MAGGIESSTDFFDPYVHILLCVLVLWVVGSTWIHGSTFIANLLEIVLAPVICGQMSRVIVDAEEVVLPR